MDCQRANRLKRVTVLAFLCFLFFEAALGFALTADDYFQQGMKALEQKDLIKAYNKFRSALTSDRNHEGANLFFALTRILIISQSEASNSLLDRAGVSASGRNIFNWTADFKRYPNGKVKLPTNSPTGLELQTFVKNNLPEIEGALKNLSRVSTSYQTRYKWILQSGSGSVSKSAPNVITDTKKS